MDVSFSADHLRRVLGSAEGKQLLALLANMIKMAKQILQPVLQTEQAQALLQKLDG